MENKENFSFSYSAQRQKEIEAIRSQYISQEENKLDQLRKLHAIPTQKAQAAALVFGILGALILGFGMSLIMTKIGAALGLFAMVLGILAGFAGMVLVALAYPVYNRVLKNQREKIAPEILRLSEELLK